MIPLQLLFSVVQNNPHADVLKALVDGCKWIQLQVSDSPKRKEEILIEELKNICHAHEATLVVEDNIELVKKLELDGVHLCHANVGSERRTLGEGFIIGATAESLSEIIDAKKTGADYVTVKIDRNIVNDSSAMLKTYADIVNGLQEQDVKIPVVACGEINAANLQSYVDTGINGIAVKADGLESGIADFLAECKRY